MHVVLNAFGDMHIDKVQQEMMNKEILDYISATLGYISGLALTVLLVIVPLMSLLDILYLLVPALKNWYDDTVRNNDKRMVKMVSHLFISKNAIEAFEDASVTNMPVLWCYMKRCIKFYIVVASVIFILTAGLDIVLGFIYKLMSGFIEEDLIYVP